MVGRLAADHEVTAWTRADARFDQAPRGSRDGAPPRAGGDHQLRELQPRRSGRGSPGDRARRQCLRGAHAGARPRPISTRCCCTTAPTSCFPARPRRPTPSSIAPEPQSAYAQSKLVGEWMAADAPGTTCCAWKACLAGRTRAAASIALPTPCCAGAAGAGVRRSGGLAQLRRRRRRRVGAPAPDAAGSSGCITA